MSARIPLRLLICCAAALPLLACAPREQQTDKPAMAPDAPRVAAAQRINLDGTRETASSAPAPLNNTPEALAARAADEVRLPDGTVGVRVDKRYYHTIVVCRKADGSFSTDCPATIAGERR
jgi:hypothetical protein